MFWGHHGDTHHAGEGDDLFELSNASAQSHNAANRCYSRTLRIWGVRWDPGAAWRVPGLPEGPYTLYILSIQSKLPRTVDVHLKLDVTLHYYTRAVSRPDTAHAHTMP